MAKSENAAFWLSPLFAPLPLLPVFSIPSSPLFLGKLMGSAPQPFLRPETGPWLAATAVLFDGTLLAYLIAGLVYLLMFRSGRVHSRMSDANGRLSPWRVLVVFGLAGLAASQLVHWAQNFREPGLREFATSWMAALFGCLCGIVAGACFTFFAKRQFTPVTRMVVYSMPILMVVICGGVLV